MTELTDEAVKYATVAAEREELEAELAQARADAQAAVALVVAELRQFVTDSYQCGCMDAGCAGRHAERNSTLEALSETLDALAPADGLAAVEALRKERDRFKMACEAQGKTVVDVAGVMNAVSPAQIEAMSAIFLNPMIQATEADRDRLAAELAAAKQREARLTQALEAKLARLVGAGNDLYDATVKAIGLRKHPAWVALRAWSAALAPTPPDTTWHERRTMLPDGDARKEGG